MEEMIESENVELRLCLKGVEASAKLETRPRGLFRRFARAEFLVFAMLILLGGLIIVLLSAIMS